MFKLSNLVLIGRYKGEETTKPVNVCKGRRKGYGTDHYFFYRSGKKVLINQADFYGGKWEQC